MFRSSLLQHAAPQSHHHHHHHHHLTPVTRLRALVARAFALGNSGRLRAADVPLVVGACRSIRGVSFLDSSACRALVNSATQRVLAANYVKQKNNSRRSPGSAAFDLSQLLWFVASPTAGRAGMFEVNPTGRPRRNPFQAELKQLSLHCHTIAHEIVQNRPSPSFFKFKSTASSSSSSSAGNTDGDDQRNSTGGRVSPYAFEASDISSYCSALQRGLSENNINNRSLRPGSSSRPSFPLESVLLFSDAWSRLCVLPRRRDQQSSKTLRQNEVAATLIGACRMLRCIDVALQQNNKMSSSSPLIDKDKFHQAINNFSTAFARRMARTVSAPSDSFRGNNSSSNSSSSNNTGGRRQGNLTLHIKGRSTISLRLIRLKQLPMSLFESEIIDVANALVRIYGPRLRGSYSFQSNESRFKDRLAVIQILNVIARRSQMRSFSVFSRGELYPALRELRDLVLETRPKLMKHAGEDNNGSDTSSSPLLDELENVPPLQKQQNFKTNSSTGEIDLRLQSGVNRVLKSLTTRYLGNRVSIAWPRGGLLPTQAVSDETAVLLFLQAVRNELYKFPSDASATTTTRDLQPLSSSSEDAAPPTTAQAYTRQLLFEKDAQGLNALVSHVAAFLRFSGMRHAKFQDFWGFGKQGRLCLSALARLLHFNDQHKVVAVATQKIIRDVFLAGMRNELAVRQQIAQRQRPLHDQATLQSFLEVTAPRGAARGNTGGNNSSSSTNSNSQSSATVILAFCSDMLNLIRSSASRTAWVDQGLVGELIDMTNAAAATIVNVAAFTNNRSGGGLDVSSNSNSNHNCRSAADILVALKELNVDLETEARSVIDLLNGADLAAGVLPVSELKKILFALRPRTTSSSSSSADGDGEGNRERQRNFNTNNGSRASILFRKVTQAKRQMQLNR